MRTPLEIIWYPNDIKKDKESGGVWVYLPKWISRAYRLNLKNFINMGRIKIIVKKHNRARIEYGGEEDCATEYWKRNWSRRLNCEEKRARKQKN